MANTSRTTSKKTSTRTKSRTQSDTERNARKENKENTENNAEVNESERQDQGDQGAGQEEPPQEQPRPPGAVTVLHQARAQLAELIGTPSETVSSFERTDDGWLLEIEVLELPRVPDTMSLMASYEVTLDPQGELTGYRRVRRYERGRSDGAHSPGGQ